MTLASVRVSRIPTRQNRRLFFLTGVYPNYYRSSDTMAATSRWTLEEMEAFRSFDAMDFDTDHAFQQGLASLGIQSDQPEEFEKAKYFYFSR